MTQTQFFEWLGAPLHNIRWSWGAVRIDGVVFLRVWQDETLKHAGRRFMRVTKHEVFVDDQSNLGYQERLQQLDLVRSGAKAYLVMCEANPNLLPEREIRDFNSDDVFLAGEVLQLDGNTWLELKGRVSARSVRPQ
jgi:hypothetical protein